MTPSPAPTQCPANQDATIKDAMSPDYPNSARDLASGPVTSVIDVTISPTGAVLGVRVASSSGNADIDVSALVAAVKSKYAPKIFDCRGVVGHYIFRVEFNPA